MIIDAKNMPYAELNKMIRDSDEQKFTLENVLGQRYIGARRSLKIKKTSAFRRAEVFLFIQGSLLRWNW